MFKNTRQRNNTTIDKESINSHTKANRSEKKSYFSSSTPKVRKIWNGRFKELKVNNCQARLLSSPKLYFKTDGEIG